MANSASITLTVGNSYSKIEGLSTHQHKQLADILSYTIDAQAAYFSNSSWNKRRTLLSKRGEFPSGLRRIVEKWLPEHTRIDNRRLPMPRHGLFTSKSNLTPYPEQFEAVEAAVRFKQGTFSMVTGFGKSVAMAALIERLQLKTLVIVPNLQLKQQLQKCFDDYFIDASAITVENIDSSRLNNCKDYDLLIIDEAHHSAAKTYRQLNKKAWTGIYYRFFYTGTPYRSQSEEQLLMESITGPVIYEVTYAKAVELGYICPVEAFYYELPKKVVDGYSWPQVYSELIVNNYERNELISELLVTLQQASISTLCLVKEIRHGDNLRVLTGIPFAHGENEHTKDLIDTFNLGSSSLIGTTGVCGEGIDSRPAEYIIVAGLGKSRNSFVQQIGRGLRKYLGKETCKVIIFKDRSHKWSLAHYAAQVKTLKEVYGIIPTKLEI